MKNTAVWPTSERSVLNLSLQMQVKGMLPKNKLSSAMLKKLKVYRGEEHPHEAQKPTPLLPN
jgi:large subunit ribosomal protein L13